ncbi:hypothetical protein NXS98_07260 [Fontisphaera persica]|uniref:hypothetical protein n=1 Tax=Fontisphaera persica TaxID=2974023 RepID=UPI0024BF11F4|nr:hypothetical protein [Fontisphaera persica]WCJ60911.1 hypothetical protein NXS98_07260 [Fontisphaera persica]
MVVQSISDKNAEGPCKVTGKFGLGFKSVFLVSDAPEVVSGNLDFVIRGGIYPVRLAAERREALVAELQRFGPAQWRRGTIIHLPLRTDNGTSAVKVTSLFYRIAPVLVIFSRKIKRLRLVRQEGEMQEMNWRAVAISNGIEVGDLRFPDVGITRALVITGQFAEDRWQLLLGLNSDGFVALPKDVPTYWVTAPTRATPDYGFAINAPFEPDVGRIQLALNSEHNHQLANEIARTLASRLKELYKLAQQNWDNLRHQLALATQTTALLFWQSFWHVPAERFFDKVSPSSNSMDTELARRILWRLNNTNHTSTGLFEFYYDCEALPTGLWGMYHALTNIPRIVFAAAGALDKEEAFTIAQQWPSFHRRIEPGCIVSSRRTLSVLRELLSMQFTIEELYLATVVEWELKCGEEYRADSDVATRLGQLLTPHFLKRLKEGDWREREERESKAFGNLLPNVKFQAADGSWRRPAELLVADGNSHEVDQEEIIRAALAPQQFRLHSAYNGSALQFFLACRPPQQTDASVLVRWIIQAVDDMSRISAVSYLLRGILRREVAEKLGSKDPNNWLWQVVERPEDFPWFNLNFSPDDIHELRAYTLRTLDEEVRRIYGTQQDLPLPAVIDNPPTDIWSVQKLWTWWDHQGCPIGEYVLEGQPNWALFGAWNQEWQELPMQDRATALREAFLATTNDTGKALWYRLFGFACLISAGRTMTELRRFWTTRLDAQHFGKIPMWAISPSLLGKCSSARCTWNFKTSMPVANRPIFGGGFSMIYARFTS